MDALRRLYETARSVAGRSRTVQAAVARLEGVVLAEHLPERMRAGVMAAIESARAETSWRLPVSDVERELEGGVDSLDEHPEAIEAHAQTHRAVLDGTPVRVKVGRPGMAASARSDLSLLDLMAAPARTAFPALDVGPLIREVRDRAVDELDFEHEAALQRRVGRALRPVEGVHVAPRGAGPVLASAWWWPRRPPGRPWASAPPADAADRGAPRWSPCSAARRARSGWCWPTPAPPRPTWTPTAR